VSFHSVFNLLPVKQVFISNLTYPCHYDLINFYNFILFTVEVFMSVKIPKNAKIKRLATNIEKESGEDVLEKVFIGADEFEKGSSEQKAAWVEQCINRLEEEAGREKSISILQSCGRGCCSQKHTVEAKALWNKAGSLQEFVDMLNHTFIINFSCKNANTILAEYKKCYCSLVKKTSRPFKKMTYCYCSTGYLKQLLEPAMGKRLEITVLQSVIAGAPSCCFLIQAA
jgi:hypothetical protein